MCYMTFPSISERMLSTIVYVSVYIESGKWSLISEATDLDRAV